MKKVLFIILIICCVSLTVSASTNWMIIDIGKISFDKDSKMSDITSKFNAEYLIDYNSNDFKVNKDFENEMIQLTKKTTYLLLGPINRINNDYIEYAQRRQELYDLRYAPIIPKDEKGEFITTSQEYKDDLATGINIPGMFKLLSEKNIKYQNFGNVKVFKTDDYVITKTALSEVTIEWPNEEQPKKIDILETNLVLTYFYKMYNNQYKLYWIMAETNDDVEDYFADIQKAESKDDSLSLNSRYVSSASEFYDYSKLTSLSDDSINNIYTQNVNNVVILNTYFNQAIVNTGVGFFINDGIIVTTWNFIEESLMDGQFILIRDKDGNVYEYDGFITATPELDIAVIKLKEKVQGAVALGDVTKMEKEDPVIAISTKTGFGLSLVSGIMISNQPTIQSLIPLSSTDEGSPLFNSKGEVIGINTAKSVNSSISEAIPTKYLMDLQKQFKSKDFNQIETISFNTLKEKYYYIKQNDEKSNVTIDDKIWNKYKKIGNIEETILLKLIKANYYDGIVSLRYENPISNLISNLKMASSFKGKLIEEGYKNIYESETKYIYENNKYKVIIMDEFNYLIVLLVRK